MKNQINNKKKLAVTFLLILALCSTFILAFARNSTVDIQQVHRSPTIQPDYLDIILPPNIAPLNFIIKEPGTKYRVRLSSAAGEPLDISCNSSKIDIPIRKWKKLLELNRGEQLQVEIFTRDKDEAWQRFDPILNHIARDSIDGYLAYRLINPAYTKWRDMGIFQRHLENFDEKPILINKETDGSCMNCHNFCNNDPDKMMLHLRAGKASGTLIGRDGKFIKVDTGTKLTKAGAYPSWHPNGKIIAFSVNKLEMFFHATGEPRDVLDRGADIILYQIETNTVTTIPLISDPERMESFPNWSPDGQYLYFCSSPKFESYIAGDTYHHDQVMYDLMRIRYHPENGTWGELETVLSAAKTGKSISMPRVSPDGRYLLFCMAKYGNFPVYMPDGDLYLLDLKDNEYRPVASDSNQADTFHSWSSNSRWFVFSSKRGDGVCARPYIAYINEQGVVGKPFVLPQKDPAFYDTFLKTYNAPELIKGPVKARPQQLVKVAFDNNNKRNAQLDPAAVAHFATKPEGDKKYAPAPQ
jgi:hypothetical protein